ncbi:Flp family type IVb pilin [Hoeflea sp.]|uniref:Flp family type IVb pilin n=1 Tax=Hoeflea sp. TaxID=1940281 RepID=UPI00374870EA
MLKILECFIKDESGATAIEYGLIGTLISVSIIAGAMTLGNTLENEFQSLADKMNDAQNAHN